jgi:hypothetical protein
LHKGAINRKADTRAPLFVDGGGNFSIEFLESPQKDFEEAFLIVEFE